MQWSDATRRPDERVLRQFGGLALTIGVVIVSWQIWRGTTDWRSYLFGGLALAGAVGLVRPAMIHWLYTGWMIAVFPIGWSISRLIVTALFFALFTPVALLFRAIGRDALRLRPQRGDSLWVPRRQAERADGYLRQY